MNNIYHIICGPPGTSEDFDNSLGKALYRREYTEYNESVSGRVVTLRTEGKVKVEKREGEV